MLKSLNLHNMQEEKQQAEREVMKGIKKRKKIKMENKLQQRKTKKEANVKTDQVIRLSASSFLKLLDSFF